MRTGKLWLAAALSAVLGVGACKTILGGDFEVGPGSGGAGAVSTTGGGGIGATGGGGLGATGGGGTGGTEPQPLPMSCAWAEGSIAEVKTLAGEPAGNRTWGNHLYTERFHGGYRVVAQRGGLELHSIDGATTLERPIAGRFVQLVRIDASRVGVAVAREMTGGTWAGHPEIVVLVVEDDDPDGTGGVETVITDPGAFPGVTGDDVRARLAPAGGSAQGVLGDVRFVATFEDGTQQAAFGFYQGGTPAMVQRISEVDTAIGGQQAYPRALLRTGEVNQFVMGEFDGRLYQFEDSVTAPAPPVRLFPEDEPMISALVPQANGELIISMFEILAVPPPLIVVYGGKISMGDLAQVQATNLTEMLVYQTMDDVFGAGNGDSSRWDGDTFLAVGSKPSSPDVMSLAIGHSLGVMRFLGEVPFPGSAPVPAGGVIRTAVAMPDDGSFTIVAGTLHVAWTHEFEDPPNEPFQVMYHGSLDCELVR